MRVEKRRGKGGRALGIVLADGRVAARRVKCIHLAINASSQFCHWASQSSPGRSPADESHNRDRDDGGCRGGVSSNGASHARAGDVLGERGCSDASAAEETSWRSIGATRCRSSTGCVSLCDARNLFKRALDARGLGLALARPRRGPAPLEPRADPPSPRRHPTPPRDSLNSRMAIKVRTRARPGRSAPATPRDSRATDLARPSSASTPSPLARADPSPPPPEPRSHPPALGAR